MAFFLSCFRTVLSVPFLSKMPFPFIIIHYLNTNKCIFSLKSHFFFARFSIYCRRGNRAKKRGCLGGRFIIPYDVGKTSQILRNPLKFAFMTIFGCKTPNLGSDVMVLYLQRVVRKLGDSVCSCSLSVQEALTGEQALIRFLV